MSKRVIRIAVIEINYHAEVLRNLCVMLAHDCFSVTIFTTCEIWRLVALNDDLTHRFNVVAKEDGEKFESYFKRNREQIDTNEVVLFNTLSQYHKLFARLNFRPRVILRVHNAMSELAPQSGVRLLERKMFSNLNRLFRRVLIGREWHYKAKFIESVDLVAFPSESIMTFAIKMNLISFEKVLNPTLPTFFANDAQMHMKPKADSSAVNIVIPGTVDFERRDYEMVLAALTLAQGRLSRNVNLTLLGAAKGKRGAELQKKFLALASDSFAVKVYPGFVENSEFSRVMSDADFMLAPLKSEARFQCYREHYGKTKISGAEADVMHYRVPALFPDHYLLGTELRLVCKSYSGIDTLAETLIYWVNHLEHEQIQQEFMQLQGLTIDNVRSNFFKSCVQLVDA